MPCHILPYNPNETNQIPSTPSISNPWFKHNTKATLFLSDSMSQPKHGIILFDGKKWQFHQGHSLKNKSKSQKMKVVIPLPSDRKLHVFKEISCRVAKL